MGEVHLHHYWLQDNLLGSIAFLSFNPNAKTSTDQNDQESPATITHNHVWSIPTYEFSGWRSSLVCFGRHIAQGQCVEGMLRDYRKIPWRLSKFQKARQRRRLRAVDSVVATIDTALAKLGETTKAVEWWKKEMPIEQEMVPKDKYTIFDRKEKKYRKGIHSEFSLGFG